MPRRRANWQTRSESDFTLGIIRDTARVGIPPGGVYTAVDMLLHKPGVAFKRGGIVQGSFAAGSGTGLIAVSYANFPGIGFQKVAVTGDTFLVDELLTGSRVGHGVISGFTSILDTPTLYVGGAHNVLVFCDSSGTEIPWFYNGGDDVQQFQGGNAGLTGAYALTITGTPTGGGFALAAQDLVSGFSYLTAEIAFNDSAGNVQTAINAVASGGTFACSGGALPGTPVSVVVPADWALSVVPAAVSGFSLTGGTDPQVTLGPVDGTATGVPTAIHSCSHLQRLLLANSSVYPNRLWFGPLLNPTGGAWDMATSWIDMDDAVSALASLSGQLLVFSNEGMVRIVGDTPPPDSNMDIAGMTHVGCTDARSIVMIEGQCIFANPRGVYVTTGIAPVALMKDRIETYWQSLFSGYDPATWTISCGLIGRRFLTVTVLDDTDALVKTFLCDLDGRAWVELSQPRAKMYASAFGAEEELYAATVDFSYLQKLSGMFTPSIANAFDAIGSFGCELETRPVPFSPTVKAFGDAHLSYDMFASVAPTPNQVLRVNASVADAWARFAFLGPETTIWITCNIAIPTASLAALELQNLVGAGSSANFPSAGSFTEFVNYADTGGDEFWANASDNSALVQVTTAEWHLCEIKHLVSDGSGALLYIDGVLAAEGATGATTSRSVLAGITGTSELANSVYYIDDFMVGTTRGGSDIFSDDFEDGTLDAWTATSGDVTVVDDPF